MALRIKIKQFLNLILPNIFLNWEIDHWVDNIPIYKSKEGEIYKAGRGDCYKLFH